jgi:hypothetical protein
MWFILTGRKKKLCQANIHEVKKLEFAALIEIGFLGLVVSVRRT